MTWADIINPQLKSPNMRSLAHWLTDVRTKANVYPPQKKIFRAFELTPFDKVKVVIVGQDPYHDGNADGLAFSCAKFITPSMQKILAVLVPNYKDTFALNAPFTLEGWAEQGVLLLNSALTVEANFPNSHSKVGWEHFTGTILAHLAADKRPKVFMGWGTFAKDRIDTAYQQANDLLGGYSHDNRLIFTEHPAKSAHENREWHHRFCFEEANKFLKRHDIATINWNHFNNSSNN